MSWQALALALYDSYGPAAKFAAKTVLGALLPGSSAVVELVGDALDCVRDTVKSDQTVAASQADLRRLEELLGTLSGELAGLMAQTAALAGVPELARTAVDAALAADGRIQEAATRLAALAEQFDRLEEQNRRLLEGQGYAADMLEELLPLVRRMAGVAGLVEEMRAHGQALKDIQAAVMSMQQMWDALHARRPSEAVDRATQLAGRAKASATAQVTVAGALSFAHDLHGVEAALGRAVSLRPRDSGLAELQRRVTRATRAVTTPVAENSAPRVGDVLDGWTLEALLGQGGWGQVFRATKDGRQAAVKVMRPELAGDPAFAERFRREILTLAGLRGVSPHLVEILDFGYARGQACWYFVMEYIEGRSLERRLAQNGPLTLPEAVELFSALAEGLGAAHQRGVVHRDIKPENILLRPDGTPVLVDFGLAVHGHAERLTRTGHTAGYTAIFASPEQLRGRPPDARSDVYTLAASMYYALKYDCPEVREPEQFDPGEIPEEVREVLAVGLDRRPERRPPHAAVFGEALQATVSPRQVMVEVPGQWQVQSPSSDEWYVVTSTPAVVTLHPGEVYCLKVAEEASDEDLIGLDWLDGLRGLKALNMRDCKALTGVGLARLRSLTCLEVLTLSFCSGVTDAELAYLCGLTSLKVLHLRFCSKVTDAGLAHLRGLTGLEDLDLGLTLQVSDAGLASLAGLSALKVLHLGGHPLVTDAGLAHLSGLSALEVLNLSLCREVTDFGLGHLCGLTALKSLKVGACTKVTEAGLAMLRDSLPECSISTSP